MYRLNHHAYCGMAGIPETFDNRTDARRDAARRLRAYRHRGYQIAVLTRGREWEILEPEDAAMVPDDCGVLTIDHVTYDCRECGSAHETREDAARCCTEYEVEYEPDYADNDDDDNEGEE